MTEAAVDSAPPESGRTDIVYPQYLVKLNSMPLRAFERIPWNLWKRPGPMRYWRCLGSFATEADGLAAADIDRSGQ